MSSKYVVLTDGVDFRSIAKSLTNKGFVMNHATSRNVLMTSLTKLIKFITTEMKTNLSDDQIAAALHDQRVHECLAEVLHKVVHQKNQKKLPHQNKKK